MRGGWACVCVGSVGCVPTFPPSCSPQIYCAPSTDITIADSGCQVAQQGNRFVFVNDGVPVEAMPCAPAGVVGNVPYQELVAGESADCVLSGTCQLPPQAPGDNLVGSQCIVNGFTSPCYPGGAGCPAGEVPVADQAGDCTTGQCCASPQCNAPNQFCGGLCTNLQTDVNNCGT